MNKDKLKSLISKKANGNNILSTQLYQMFFFEHLLMRIERSKYKHNIILKGGLLLSSIIGENLRTTKDMDTTLKGIELEENKMEFIFSKILNINVDDNIIFEIVGIKDIRVEDEYGGFQLNILGRLDNIKTHILVEITTGDVITPKEIKYKYNCIFEDKTIDIMAYTIETVIAEKFQTIINRSILNTRGKDFYDLYVLLNNHKNQINNAIMIDAIKKTFKRRETEFDVIKFREILEDIKNDSNLNSVWKRYKNTMIYAKDIDFNEIMESVEEIIDMI